MNPADNKELLSPSKAAKMLMVSPITLRQWAQRGLLPAYTTLGGHRRFRVVDIEKFAKNNNIGILNENKGVLRILIIDDDEGMLRFLNCMFSEVPEEKVEVETAINGFDGGLKIYSFKPDFLLLDLKMHGMDGFEVCKQVKGDKATSNIRVLTMTGYSTKENTDRILSLGAEACFSKPLDINALLTHMDLIKKA
ncbi:MAG: response regulator [Alcanivoracaceae bacterium]|nr:response regulator [Alcanivoracaceae bacterium]